LESQTEAGAVDVSEKSIWFITNCATPVLKVETDPEISFWL
jgi:hypothetical protein